MDAVMVEKIEHFMKIFLAEIFKYFLNANKERNKDIKVNCAVTCYVKLEGIFYDDNYAIV
jgi:hypothetical protein